MVDFATNKEHRAGQSGQLRVADIAGSTDTAPTIRWSPGVWADFSLISGVFSSFPGIFVEKWPISSLGISCWYVIAKEPSMRETVTRVRKFANFFAKKVSNISAVVAVFSQIERDVIDICTIFNSDDEQTYDRIYKIEQQTFAEFRGVNADFHSINLKNFKKHSVEEFIPDDAKVLLLRP